MGYRFRQKPKLCSDYRMKAKDFYEKRKGNYYMNRGNKFLIVLTVTLAINDRLLILFSEKNIQNDQFL